MEFQLILHKYHESLELEFNPFLLAFEWAALKLIFGFQLENSPPFCSSLVHIILRDKIAHCMMWILGASTFDVSVCFIRLN